MLTLLLAAAVGAKSCFASFGPRKLYHYASHPVLAFRSVATDGDKRKEEAMLAMCVKTRKVGYQYVHQDFLNRSGLVSPGLNCSSSVGMTVNDDTLVVAGNDGKTFNPVFSISFIPVGVKMYGTPIPTASIGVNFIRCMGANRQSLTAVGRTVNFGASYAVDIYDNTGGLKLSIPINQSPLAVSVSKFLGASTSYYVAVMTSDGVTLYFSNGVVKDSHELKTSRSSSAVRDMRFRDADHALVISTWEENLIVYSNSGDTTTPLKQKWNIRAAVFNDDASKMVALSHESNDDLLILVDTQTGAVRHLCDGLRYRRLAFAANAEGVEMIMAVQESAMTYIDLITVPAVTDVPATLTPPTYPPPTVAPPSSSTPIGAIIGGAIGGVVLLIAAVVGFCLWKKRRTPTPLNKNVEWGAPAPPTNDYVAMLTVGNCR